jgi:hypothetical protein
MGDDFSRDWVDEVDDTDAESMNDLEGRMEARVATNLGGGVELGYIETDDFGGAGNFTTSSTATNGVAVPDLSVGVVVAARPILVRVFASAWFCDGGFGGGLILYEDGSPQGFFATVGGSGGSGVIQNLTAVRRRNPAAGPHTYSLHAKVVSGGTTLTIVADDGVGAHNSPAALQVVEV